MSFHECMGMNIKQKTHKASSCCHKDRHSSEDAFSNHRKANSEIFEMSPFLTNPKVPPKHKLFYLFSPLSGRFSTFFCNWIPHPLLLIKEKGIIGRSANSRLLIAILQITIPHGQELE